MKRLVALLAVAATAATAPAETNTAASVVELVRNAAPTNWILTVTVDPAAVKPLRGLTNATAELRLTDPSKTLTHRLSLGKRREFQPVVFLLVYPASELKQIEIAAAADPKRAGLPMPLIFGAAGDAILVTSPGYVNEGLTSADSLAVVRELKDSLGKVMDIR